MKRKKSYVEKPKRKIDFFDKIELPTDIILGESILMMQENRSLQLQNVKGMIECRNEKVQLLTRKNKIEVTGKNLDVIEYSKDEILIKGRIEQILYLEK